jgi:DNA repair protein RecN (Recombination protein N)
MNVLTGETGAGKSFILKSIEFLMGERLTADMVRPGGEKAQVEALFSLSDGELVLRRELVAETGRSRFFINDSLSSQEAVRTLRPRLILHATQHGQQRLLQPAFQSRLVDDWMGQDALLAEKNDLVRQWKDIADRLEETRRRMRELEDRRELLEMRRRMIDKIAPQPEEEEKLELLRREWRDQETARRHCERIGHALHGEQDSGLLAQLSVLEQSLEHLAKTDEDFREYLKAAGQFRLSMRELEQDLRRRPSSAERDMEELEARLYALAQLKRKLQRTLPEILALRAEIDASLSFLDVCGLDIGQWEKEQAAIREQLARAVGRINALRREAAARFAATLEKELLGLGFSEHVRVVPEFASHELAPGCREERVRLLWAPNPGQAAQALDRIASGGELSRFLLGVMFIAARHEEATLIFDEVDAGVGGATLNRVGERLELLAGQRQMLLITHWPQLAARAVRHFSISKTVLSGRTFTQCLRLEDADRKKELDRMAGIE